MSDLSTFRIVRSPQNRAVPAAAVYRPLDPEAAALPMLRALYSPPTEKVEKHTPTSAARQFVTDGARYVVAGAPSTASTQVQRQILDGLRSLDHELTDADNEPTSTDLDAQLARLVESVAGVEGVAGLIASSEWSTVKSALCESLAAALVLSRPSPQLPAAQSAMYASQASDLNRRLLVMGLVEWRYAETTAPTSAAIYAALHDRTLVLPPTPGAPRRLLETHWSADPVSPIST